MSSRVAVLLLVPLLALAGCGEDPGPTAEDAPSPSPTASSATPTASGSTTPSPLPTMTPPTAPPSAPSDAFERVRVSGTVTAVGACVQLTDGNGVTWELRGPGLESLAEGQQVVVSGKGLPEDGTCGAPLSVTTLETTAD